MICFYHIDDDGKCAAALVNRYGQHDSYPDQFIPMNYGYEVPFDKIATDEQVYIVDFSIEPEDMVKLLDITQCVVWIDHHITAIKKYDSFTYEGEPYMIPGIRDNAYSGCMLTALLLLYPDQLEDECLSLDDIVAMNPIDCVVRACDDYDMWRFKYDTTKRFHFGFSIIPHDPEETVWDELFEKDPDGGFFEYICRYGESMIEYRANLMEELIDSYGYESVFEGHPCYVLNQGIAGSDDFESIDLDNYDLLIAWVYNGEKYSYSLRSVKDKVDVSEIARKYGGGGHKAAAGFSSEELLVHRIAESSEATK